MTDPRRLQSGKHTLWDLFSMTEGGRLKSPFLLYSFVLGLVFLACYVGGYALLPAPVGRILPAGLPTPLINLIETLAASAAGTALCLLLSCPVRDKRLVWVGFLWITGSAALLSVVLLLNLPAQQRPELLALLGMFAVAPAMMGNGCAFALYRRWARKSPQAAANAHLPEQITPPVR